MNNTELLSMVYNFCNENGVELTDSAIEEMNEAGVFENEERSDYQSVIEYCMENGIILSANQIANLKDTFNESTVDVETIYEDYEYMYEFMCEYVGVSLTESAYDTMLESGQIDLIVNELEGLDEGFLDNMREKSRHSKAVSAAKKELKNEQKERQKAGQAAVNWDDSYMNKRVAEIEKGLKADEEKKNQERATAAQNRREEAEANRQERQQNRNERAEAAKQKAAEAHDAHLRKVAGRMVDKDLAAENKARKGSGTSVSYTDAYKAGETEKKFKELKDAEAAKADKKRKIAEINAQKAANIAKTKADAKSAIASL